METFVKIKKEMLDYTIHSALKKKIKWFQIKMNPEAEVYMPHFDKIELKYIGFPYSFIDQKMNNSRGWSQSG